MAMLKTKRSRSCYLLPFRSVFIFLFSSYLVHHFGYHVGASPLLDVLPPVDPLSPTTAYCSNPPFTPPSTTVGGGGGGGAGGAGGYSPIQPPPTSYSSYSPTTPPYTYEPTPPSSSSIPTPTPTPPTFYFPAPPLFEPPVVYPPPTAGPPSPPRGGGSTALWCVAKPSVPDPIIQEAMDYACGSGADCDSVQPAGSCFQPDTLFAHASYAFNSYWQRTKVAGGTCEFGGSAMLVTVDPSYDGCHFIYF